PPLFALFDFAVNYFRSVKGQNHPNVAVNYFREYEPYSPGSTTSTSWGVRQALPREYEPYSLGMKNLHP
ncbi:MAG: hypothetical protein LBG27_12120, partial [Spirochaetaceae bacterium]|nr:hypothetical protein [Spirochaetaceae bacterium]